jgi:ArsR family transcriptional regulator
MKDLLPLFNALADESRLRILHLLFESGELCVCDIEATLGFTQTKVSRHLSYLKRSGLIQEKRCGRWMLYSITDPKTEHQRMIIGSIQTILQSHKQTQKDAAKLKRRVNDGCCATFVHVKPNERPSKMRIN